MIMERILLAVNTNRPDLASIEFATRIASLARTKLTVLFLETVHYEPILIEKPEVLQYSVHLLQTGEVTVVHADIEKAIELVQEECRFAGVDLEVIPDSGDPLRQTIYESRFADFVILDPGMSFSHIGDGVPSHFVKEVLVHAECPVLLSPREFVGMEEVVFCFDGSPSSVFAIKQFTLLLPQFRDKHVLLLEVDQAGRDETDGDDRKRMMDWLNMHYRSAACQLLRGKAKDELLNFLFLKTKTIVIMGAYGRSMLSNFFRKSHADALIRMADLPLFIAHL
jgi:hypothetical protein